MNTVYLNDKKHYILQTYKKYFYVFSLFFFCGCGLVLCVNDAFLLCSYDGIKVHFELPFWCADSTGIILESFMSAFAADIFCIAIVFLFSFTAQKNIAVFLMLIYNGIKTGFGCMLLILCKNHSGDFPQASSIFAFFTFCAVINFVFCMLFYRFQNYNDSFIRRILYVGFVLLSIFIVRFTYCLIIYLI